MSNTRTRFKLSALSLAVVANCSAMMAYANEAENADEEIEVIEVTGIKGSLIKSINDKRFAGNVMDTINAEDVGKNTDQNIADALGRVTGVSVVSRNGEGSSITVRGAGANQNNISLNGQQLTSTDFSQSVDLSSFSADILDRLEVVKTPSANHDEGSLGANVNLKTLRPLNKQNEIKSLNIQGRYNDLSEENNYKISGVLTKKFLDETLGVSLSAYSETNAYRKDEYRVERFEASQTFRVARDQNGDVINEFRGVAPSATRFLLSENESNRTGASLGIQFLPSDTSELMFDVTYSRQDLSDKTSSITTSTNKGNTNFVRGVQSIDSRPDAPFTDPEEDWYSVDTDTLTVTKYLNRFGRGGIAQNVGGTINENLSSTLDFKLDITDSLRMNFLAGYSSSESTTKPNGNAILSNGKHVNATILYDVGADVVPVGFDCTTGKCLISHGDQMVDFGDLLVDGDVDGEYTLAWTDNKTNTGFHASDLQAQNLEWIREVDRTVDDELASLALDFEYDVDALGIRSIEFGGKTTQRSKYVDDQAYRFETLTRSENFIDANGNVVAVQGGTIKNINGSDIADDEAIPDDFMASLGYPRHATTSGWYAPDPIKALNAIVADDDTLRVVDPSKTRSADIDTQALYFKTNLELFDGIVTGDVGFRYVKTQVEATGFAGASFFGGTGDFERIMSLIDVKNLRDESLPACSSIAYADPENTQGYEKKFQRIDGLGWDTSSGPDPAGWTRIPDQGPCHEPSWVARVETQDKVANPVDWLTMWRHADISTSQYYGWGAADATTADISWNGEGSVVDASDYSYNNIVAKNKPIYAASGSHEYSNLLPSLNLNIAMSDSLVGRFAVSKTMTRPEIDLLKPGAAITEAGYWNVNVNKTQNNRIEKTNTKLDPLTSNNLDLSLEWYFNNTSMLSVAFFAKNMSNFVDTQRVRSYIKDIRNLDSISADDLPIQVDESLPNSGLSDCMPQRVSSTGVWGFVDPTSNPLSLSDDYKDLCAEYEIISVVNSKSAEVRGLEFGYSQTYDFLPGLWSGLGASANYTYQQSEYEAEVSEVDSSVVFPSLPVADTPKHTYNLTTFWENKGHQVRLSYRGSTDSLVGIDYPNGQTSRGRNWNGGSIWNEGRNTFDLSATYKVNNSVNVTLQAINLTDESYRQYYTSRDLEVVRMQDENGDVTWGEFNEGNPLDGEAPTHRTYREYKVGRTFRLGVNVRF
ncbi:TonB-dependent receptor [Algibacillus agarilyticus]|uniref:TonB-dependent receptor n=1 Tax=Algibacillus agarilyticus TaxID=2234133 RepID=UPI000DD017D5|nr:TonB-dependent receptor [Algibacillus agarilyticus]